MNGIVLWTGIGTALIWCEDQGPLAYCDTVDVTPGVTLSNGDLVTFQPEQSDELRLAHNVRQIAANVAPGLADYLKARDSAAHAKPRSAKVIPFDPARKSRGRAAQDDATRRAFV